MTQTRTIVCRLAPTPAQALAIDSTLESVATACNLIAGASKETGLRGKRSVQKDCYHDIRQETGLSANLVVRAIARVCTAIKAARTRGRDQGMTREQLDALEFTFRPTSADYDARVFDYREASSLFSLTLNGGRQKVAAVLGEWQRQALAGQKPTSATLCRGRDGSYTLNVHIKDAVPELTEPQGFLGLDMGVVNLAVTDDGEVFKGDGVEAVRRKYSRIRKTCQSKGTKSSKRKLRRSRAKEASYRRNTNHVISKRVVAKAKGTGNGIALEDLEGISNRTTAQKAYRSRLKGWAFYQLRFFIEYKARLAGVVVRLVDPAYTSQTCSRCQHKERANRKTRDEFLCKACGHASNADLNAAKNIAFKASLSLEDQSELGRCQAA